MKEQYQRDLAVGRYYSAVREYITQETTRKDSWSPFARLGRMQQIEELRRAMERACDEYRNREEDVVK